MSKNKAKKANDWDAIDKDIKDKILTLRAKERELLIQSGYNDWKKYFLAGYLIYAVSFYALIARKSGLNNRNLAILLAPALPYGLILNKLYFNKNLYKEYYLTHLELNRVIKKTSKSSEYK